MLTSLLNHAGFGTQHRVPILAIAKIGTPVPNHAGSEIGPEPCQVQGWGKGSKKIPSLLHEDWGFYPLSPFTVSSSKTSQ
jgi:hypothetical protein